MYIGSSLGGYDINEVERVEVIKGPQSALFGRNTYSGAINMVTKSPGDEFSGDIKLEVAEDEQYEISGAIRGPIIDGVLSGSLSGRYYERDGVFENRFDGEDVGEQESQSVAGLLEWTPTDSLRVRGRIYYAELDDGQPGLYAQSASENNCFEDQGSLYNGLGRYFCGELEPRDVNSDWQFQAPNARDEVDTLQTSLQVESGISTKQWSLTSITGYNEEDNTMIAEADYGPTAFDVANFTPNGFPFAGFPIPPFDYGYVGSIVDFTFASDSELDEFSQEIRLRYDGDGFHAMAGVYYYDASDDSRDIRDLPEGAEATALGNYLAELTRMNGRL